MAKNIAKRTAEIDGEKGLVIGIDRLSEMIEKANYIRGKKGFLTTDFRVSDIDDLIPIYHTRRSQQILQSLSIMRLLLKVT